MSFLTSLNRIFKKKRPRHSPPPPPVSSPPQRETIDAVLVDAPVVNYVLTTFSGGKESILGVYRTPDDAQKAKKTLKGSRIVKIINPIVVDGKVYKST